VAFLASHYRVVGLFPHKSNLYSLNKQTHPSCRRMSHIPDDGDDELLDTGCLVCGKDNHHDKMLLCDACLGEYHMYCLKPKLDKIPKNKWFCGKYCSDVSVAKEDTQVQRPFFRHLQRQPGKGHGETRGISVGAPVRVQSSLWGNLLGARWGRIWMVAMLYFRSEMGQRETPGRSQASAGKKVSGLFLHVHGLSFCTTGRE
jgi:hypothetical protein